MSYIIQMNSGHVFETKFKGEARFWAWLSMDMIVCNVFAKGGCGVLLSPFDI